MGLQDFIIGPFILLLILAAANFFKGNIQDEEMKRYFSRGLQLKLAGSFFVALIYLYYYGTGDTIFYYRRAVFITNVMQNNLWVGLKLIFANSSVYDYETASFFDRLVAKDASSYLVVRIAAFFNIFCFNSYVAITFLYTAFSYIGIWRGFVTFVDIFPKYKKELAISFLFIPSVIFWGSGIFKDTLTFGFLGILVSSTYYILIKPKNIPVNLVLLIISVYVIGIVKSYILLALLPATAVWVFLVYRSKISSPLLKTLSTPIFVGMGMIASILILNGLASAFKKFSIDNIQSRAEDMQRWHTYRVEVLKGGDGSSYTLGEVDFSPMGILKKTPAAINVALFRPYLWEVRSPLMILSALESLVLLYLSLFVLFKLFSNFGKISSLIVDNPTLLYMLVFSLIFAFSVGFTSYNFGALSRYRIPILPFYAGFLLIINSYIKGLSKKVVK
jgi:hypothetical protein